MNVMEQRSRLNDQRRAFAGNDLSTSEQVDVTTAIKRMPATSTTQPAATVANTQNSMAFLNSLPSYFSPATPMSDEMLFRSLIMARDSGTLDQADATDLIRKRIILAEQQARFELISKIAALNDQNKSAASVAIAPSAPTGSIQNSLASYDSVAKLSSTFVNKPGSQRLQDLWTEGSVLKKARIEKKAISDVVFSLSESERKATFPLPSATIDTASKNKNDEEKVLKVGKLSFFRKTWSRLERHSDRMDDTSADQEAFVSEFFVRSLHYYGNDHLKRKVRDALLSESKNGIL